MHNTQGKFWEHYIEWEFGIKILLWFWELSAHVQNLWSLTLEKLWMMGKHSVLCRCFECWRAYVNTQRDEQDSLVVWQLKKNHLCVDSSAWIPSEGFRSSYMSETGIWNVSFHGHHALDMFDSWRSAREWHWGGTVPHSIRRILVWMPRVGYQGAWGFHITLWKEGRSLEV